MSKHTEEKKHYMYNCTDRDMKKNVNTVLILKVWYFTTAFLCLKALTRKYLYRFVVKSSLILYTSLNKVFDVNLNLKPCLNF